MKMAMTALAVVLLAAPAAALAAPGEGERVQREDRPSRGEMNRDRPQRDGGGPRGGDDTPRVREAPQAPRAAEAPSAPEAPRAAGNGERRGEGRGDQGRGDRGGDRGGGDRSGDRGGQVPGDSVGRPGPWVQNGGGQALNQGGRDRGGDRARGDGDNRRGAGQGDGRRDGDGRNWNRGDGRPDGDWRKNDRRGDGRSDNDRRGDNRRDNDRRDNDRRDWDRDHRRDNDRDHRRWERGRYPSVYFSSHRYRHSWRPPSGFYVRAWAFGDFLPRSWYGPEYYLLDPWEYDLPLPPPGFDWVRVGGDALLVDRYTGRVIQVVRDVFW